MKNTSIMIVGLLLLGLIISLLGCRLDKDNPDPCIEFRKKYEKPKLYIGHAPFTSETGPWPSNRPNLDSVLILHDIIFESLQEYDSYYWKIGEDTTVWNTKKFTLAFKDPYEQVKVVFIGKRKPSSCMSNDDGRDTVIRTIEVIHLKKSPMIGRYFGKTKWDPDKPFQIEFKYSEYHVHSQHNLYWPMLYIENFVDGCKRKMSIYTTWNAFSSGDNGCDMNTGSFGEYDPITQKMTISFQRTRDSISKEGQKVYYTYQDTFTGFKVN
jgi:hypothetical protein